MSVTPMPEPSPAERHPYHQKALDSLSAAQAALGEIAKLCGDQRSIDPHSVVAAVRERLNRSVATAPQPRQVATVEDLTQLPPDSVVRCSNALIWERDANGLWWNDGECHSWSDIDLPATVFWRPDE